jgi:hypothetical protein
MQDQSSRAQVSASLPVILLAAVVQGWALYWLHNAIKGQHWPATDLGWLVALYSLVLFVPMTLQMLAPHARQPMLWAVLAAMAVGFFYFGWHQGGSIAVVECAPDAANADCTTPWDYFPYFLVSVVLWLHLLPFLQARLQIGRWTTRYDLLFSAAWRNVLMLLEAAIFTGLFWLLLLLWQQLFHMLGIDFFRELFEQPLFVYPVTALAVGIALHLIGSIERLTSVLLEQILGVLKWLALVVALLLALFTATLVVKMPGLVFQGQRAIGATWLLWLVAIEILLLNAAYRDGSALQPYPRRIGVALRLVVPLAVIVALTATYSLTVRATHYGLTVERVWAFAVAGAALFYSIGYSIAAFKSGAWLRLIARVNVAVAIALIALLAASLTPALSPYRLAAESQYRMALAHVNDSVSQIQNTPFHYLRFDAGRYGLAKLRELAAARDRPDAQALRTAASAALAQKNRWDSQNMGIQPEWVPAKLVVYPTGRALDTNLAAHIAADLGKSVVVIPSPWWEESAGLYIDLDGDDVEEFVLLFIGGGLVYENRDGQWARVGRLYVTKPSSSWETVRHDLEAGNYSAIVPRWKRLSIGGQEFQVPE